MEEGFEKATSQNLPVVDSTMVFEFYRTNTDFSGGEVKNVKASRYEYSKFLCCSYRAIGYVKLRRNLHICIVKGQITPEHKVREKGYNVMAEIDEAEEKIITCKCLDCPASEGGCKHSVAFLLWLHRRSEEPSVTAVECYWKKSNLSRVGSTAKFVSVEELATKPVPDLPVTSNDFLTEALSEGRKLGCTGTLFRTEFESDPISKVSVHKLLLLFKRQKPTLVTSKTFMTFMEESMDDKIIKSVEEITRMQYKTPKWYEARYARITASKLYEASRCSTFDGSLVEQILGGGRFIETEAVLRGKRLEDDVLDEVSKVLSLEIRKCGLFLNKHFPTFGASPDGINETHVFEVKCPSKEKTISNYITDSDKLTPAPYCQIQLQMVMTDRSKGYFCVASPSFETSKEVRCIEVDFNPSYISNVMKKAESFWKSVIFNHLIK